VALRVVQRRSVFEHQHGKVVRGGAGGGQQHRRLRVALYVDPAIGNEIAGEKALDAM